MPVSLNRALSHIKQWSRTLAPFPTRSHWPRYLFHTCQLEVAVEIIKSGQITCRANVKELICDVANQGALWNNPEAHNYVRLYFRPRNGFHLKTEGVKAVGDPYRAQNHMSIPVAFAFEFQRVITLPGSGFVPGNFAKSGTAPLTEDAEFDALPFDLIYHDAALPPGKIAEVHNWRMSEVVVPTSLSLNNLSCVICRTTHEERTLRHLLGGNAAPNIMVEQRGSFFMRRGMFMDEVFWSAGRLNFQFHGPTVYAKDNYNLRVVCHDRGKTREACFTVKGAKRYHISSMPASKDAVWEIYLENCIVYHAQAPSVAGLVTP